MQCELCEDEAYYRVHLSKRVKLHLCKRCSKEMPVDGLPKSKRKKKAHQPEKADGPVLEQPPIQEE